MSTRESPTAEAEPWLKVGERALQRDAARDAAKVYQLAFWPDEKRAMPADFITCALFAGIQEKDASYVDGAEIVNANGLRIHFKGQRLTQVHADVWQGVMHLARKLPEGSTVRFRARPFLKMIGRHTGKKQRDDLKNWFTDLTATSVEIVDTNNKRRFWGSLLPNGASQDASDDTTYVVQINRELARLFADIADLGAVNWEVRQKLFKKPLALWWQYYISKFKKPVPVAQLHRLSGSKAQLKEFRRKLAIAMRVVEEAGGFPACIDRATDTAVLTRTPALPALPRKPAVFDSLEQPKLPLPQPLGQFPPVRAATMAKFRTLYPEHDGQRCLHDWRTWLAKTGRTAEKPDAAFLGYARKWVAGKSAS